MLEGWELRIQHCPAADAELGLFGEEGFGVWDLGFRIWDLGLGNWDLAFGVWDLGLGI